MENQESIESCEHLWGALRHTAKASPATTLSSPRHVVEQRSTILDKFTESWMSGYLPLLLLCVTAAYVSVGPRYSSRPGVWVASLALAPIIAWILRPMVAGVYGLTPGRTLATTVSLLWVVPGAQLFASVINVENPYRGLSVQTDRLYSMSSLSILLAETLVIVLFSYWIQGKAFWYDQRPLSKRRRVLGGAVVTLPLCLYLALFVHTRPSPESREWESKVLADQVELQRFLKTPNLSKAWEWERLDRATEVLESWQLEERVQPHQQDRVRTLETLALSLWDESSLGQSGRWSATESLARLAGCWKLLEDPAQIFLLAQESSMLTGEYRASADYLASYTRERVLVGGCDKLETQKMVATFEALIKRCPSRVQQGDLRWYMYRSPHYGVTWWQRNRITTSWSPRQLTSDLLRNLRVENWLMVRPFLVQGQSWHDLENCSSEMSDALQTSIHQLRFRDAHRTFEDELKPKLETFLLLCKLRLHQVEHGAFPANLEDLNLTLEPNRWVWTAREDKGTLRDLKAKRMGHQPTWSFE